MHAHHHPYWAIAIVCFIAATALAVYCVIDARRDRKDNHK